MAGLLRSSAKVGVAVMTSRLLGVLRESLFAGLFAVSPLTDAYGLAFRIPNLLRDLFAEGALSGAFVPAFARTSLHDGQEAAFRLGNLVLTGVLLVTGGLTLLGLLFAAPLVNVLPGSAVDATRLAIATPLLRIMMPILSLVSLSAVWMGMLNAQGRFSVPAYAPAMFNVTCLLAGGAIAALGWKEGRAMYAWSAATTLAAAVQAFWQLPALWALGYRPRLVVRGLLRDPRLREIARLMGPAVIGLAAVQVNVLVNTTFALGLGTGPLSYLNYAFRLFYLPVGVFGVALGVITTTRMSEDAARGDQAGLVARTQEGLRAAALLASASAVGLVVLAEPIVELLYETGLFTKSHTATLVPVVQAYMAGVLPYCLSKILVPAFYTIGRTRLPMLASLAGVFANLLFNALTHKALGAPGLALGMTVAALVNGFVLWGAFRGGVARGAPLVTGRDLACLLLGNGLLALVSRAGWRGAAWLLGQLETRVALVPYRPLHGAFLLAVIAGSFWVYAAFMSRLRYPGADDLLALPSRAITKLRRR